MEQRIFSLLISKNNQRWLIVAGISISETQVNGTTYILSLIIKEQLRMMLQNVNEVNRERTLIAEASSVHDLTGQSGLLTICLEASVFFLF